MSFGPYPFRSGASSDGLMRRYLLFYLLPVALVIGGIVVVALSLAFGVSPQTTPMPAAPPFFLIVGFVLFYLLFLALFGLISLSFYAAYFRQAIGALTLGHLEFEFTARTKDWLKLMLGTIALVVCTLGVGSIFIGYRNWAFFIRHLRAYGSLDLDQFTQSTTRAPGQGEGLFDSLDMGAF
jgi:uncharacterized membrane protein YjgN (DUF898 family)